MDNGNTIKFKTVIKYFWEVIRKHPWMFFIGFVLMGAGQVFSGVIAPIYYKRIIDIISSQSPSAALDLGLLEVFIMLVIVIVLYNVVYRAGDVVIILFQSRALKNLADQAFSKIKGHSYKFFTNTFAGSLVAKHKRYLRAFERMHDDSVFSFWMTFIVLVGSFTVLFTSNLYLGFFFLGWSVVYISITYFLSLKKIPYSLDSASADSDVTAHLSDSISNILNIKIFSSSQIEQNSFEQITTKQWVVQRRAWLVDTGIRAVQGLLMLALEVVGMYIAIRLWLSGVISTGTVVLVQIYIGTIFASLWNLGRSITRFATAYSDAVEMVEIFEKKPDVLDPENPKEFAVKSGEIEFKDVTFAYDEDNRVFDKFSLKIPSGQKVGLVGESGAGKTTITKIILRFADVSSGKVLIDGQDISESRQEDVRRAISYVPQEPLLFHRSLKENISYGKPGASMDEIIGVAKKAKAHDFIKKLPKGYETLVGERGIKLSGGERQRVAIARAMLEDAPILILDEATSSLDSVSEKSIQEAFEELIKDKTAIVIAHRLSTIRKMDRILVMGEGSIIEEGSHEELIEKGGAYSELWNHQLGGFIK